MKKGKVFFNPIDGSAPLSISWSSGPKGDAVEAKNEVGVGFFSSKGDLLGVIFDDVDETKDHQVLEFDHYQVEVTTKAGVVTFDVKSRTLPQRKTKKAVRKGKAA